MSREQHTQKENVLLTQRNILFAPTFNPTRFNHNEADTRAFLSEEREFLLRNFCGRVILTVGELMAIIANKVKKENDDGDNSDGVATMVYLTGNVNFALNVVGGESRLQFCVVDELSELTGEASDWMASGALKTVTRGQLPINVHGVGVLFRRFFESKEVLFDAIEREHQFQILTESNKDGVAMRKGIYLTDVQQDASVTTASADGTTSADGLRAEANIEANGDTRFFRLLRCSSNLRGPTDNLRATDRALLRDANAILPHLFHQRVELNHVLAQIYYNGDAAAHAVDNAQKKATIKRHSDKTKDMPAHGVIAFATFYDFSKCNLRELSCCSATTASFDVFCRQQNSTGKKTSVLTEIEFLLKNPDAHPTLTPQFRVTLTPNSMFVISLETNRLYTHEIKPSILNVERIPTRLGYVMRCSSTRAVHRNGQTFILSDSASSGSTDSLRDQQEETPMRAMCAEDAQFIKNLYRDENLTEKRVEYGVVLSSFNDGDYMQPLL